jgi:hypothetical protein
MAPEARALPVLYIQSVEETMPVSTVNISSQTQLLNQIDEIANDEARTRSESI